MIDFRDLLAKVGLDAKFVMVMRHRPTETALRRTLPWLAADEHDLFNAYQSIHSERVERSLARATHLASFLGNEPGRALFVGIYEVAGWTEISVSAWRETASARRLLALGDRGPEPGRQLREFNLKLTAHFAEWKGCLQITWPGPERSWWRWADRNEFVVRAIHADSELTKEVPPWTELVLGWSEIQALPRSWKAAIAQWRGVYLILDRATGQSYVGSAYGGDNLLSRWEGYAATGHGGNAELKGRDPANFQFSILERASPDTSPDEVIALEASWKRRLGTREFGLNKN